MCEPLFESLESLELRMLSYKTALLLTLASVKHVSNLHALLVHLSCIQFVLDRSKVVLHPNAAYTPKAILGAYSALLFELPALSKVSEKGEDRRIHPLCTV